MDASPLVSDAPETRARSRARQGMVAPMVGGFVAILAVSVGGVLAGSPFDTHLPGAWPFGMGHFSPWLRDLGKAGVFTGVAGLLWAWYRIVLYLRQRPETPVRTILIVFAVWVLPLLVAPPLFSQDTYSYVAQGTMVADSVNPYYHGPVAITNQAPHVVALVDPIWRTTAVPYGPLFLGLEAGSVELSAGHEAIAIEELRILALVGVLLGAAAIPTLARRASTSLSLGVALLTLNPLTLLGLISPGHNDALMAGLILGGLALYYRGRPAWAVFACALAAAAKDPALVAVAFVAWGWAGPEASWTARLRSFAAASAITVGVLEATSLLTGVGWGWIPATRTPGLTHSVLTPSTDLAFVSEDVVRLLHFGPSTSLFIAAWSALGYLAAAGLLAGLIWRSRQLGMFLALGLALLALVALGPIFQPWYLVWGLFCLAPIATGRWQVFFVVLSTYGAISTLPRFEPLVSSLGIVGDGFGLAVVGGFVWLATTRGAAIATRASRRVIQL